MALDVARYTAVQRDITQVLVDGIMSATPFYPNVCTIVPSQGEDEKYAWIGAVPRMKEWLGDRQFDDMRAADYTLKNRDWESSLQIPRYKIDDDRMGTLRPSISQMGIEAGMHPDELLAIAINDGENQPCFDGQNFYDTDHQWGESGVQSNIVSETVTDVNNVTVEEFRDSFTNAVVRMMSFKRDNGTFYYRPTIGRVDGLMVSVPLALWDVATKAFEQTISLEAGVAGTSNVQIARPTVVVNQYMGAGFSQDGVTGSDTRWDLYNLDPMQQLRPFVFQARQPLRAQTKGPEDIEFKFFKSMTEARYNVGYLAWWTAVRVQYQ